MKKQIFLFIAILCIGIGYNVNANTGPPRQSKQEFSLSTTKNVTISIADMQFDYSNDGVVVDNNIFVVCIHKRLWYFINNNRFDKFINYKNNHTDKFVNKQFAKDIYEDQNPVNFGCRFFMRC